MKLVHGGCPDRGCWLALYMLHQPAAARLGVTPGCACTFRCVDCLSAWGNRALLPWLPGATEQTSRSDWFHLCLRIGGCQCLMLLAKSFVGQTHVTVTCMFTTSCS